jgi:CubicO group peptidase (beta-lactamase class C family)
MPLPETVQEQVDAVLNHGLDGSIVYVDQAGTTPRLYASGWKNRASQLPADPQALFKIASISKLYIAAATVRLINNMKLSLDSKLADLLPELVGRIENADQITLRMLLQHRSGILNFTDQPEFDWSRSPADTGENLALILDKPADFEPDSRYSYSNTNYLLIGSILDRTLGYDHQLFIKNEFLIPLGLNSTYGSLEQVDIEDVVSGYHKTYDEDWREVRYLSASGAMLASAEDVGVFLRALNDGSLLTDDEQAVYSSVYEYEHTGWVLGYQSIARYHEDIDTVVVQFVNTTSGNGESELAANVIYDRIVRILSL